MEKINVSVVIPVFNGEKTLFSCLESILNQDSKNYEVLVVDNNSNDNTKKIINYFEKKSQKIKYLFEPIKSRGAARNKGISKAKGKIVLMTDSDCTVPKNWISSMIFPILNKGEVAVQGEELPMTNNWFSKLYQEGNIDFKIKQSYGKNYINLIDTKNFAIVKRAILEAGNFNINIEDSEDFEMKVRLKKLGYRVYYLKNIKVNHFHPEKPFKFFFKQVNRGYWTKDGYYLHKTYLDKNYEDLIESAYLRGFFNFFIGIGPYFLKNNFRKSLYMLLAGSSFRIGFLLSSYKKFLRDNI